MTVEACLKYLKAYDGAIRDLVRGVDSSAYGSCDNSKENIHMGSCSGSLVLVVP